MLKLRQYQLDAIETITQKFTTVQKQYIEMPTGSGKTVTFLSYAAKHHKKVLVIVPSRELLNQVYETSSLFYHHSYVSRKGGQYREKIKNLHICIINSISEDYLEILKKQDFDLIIVDEAHHSQAKLYRRLIFSMPCKVLGVTATPERIDGQFIEEVLGECSFKIKIIDLINERFLSDIEGYSVKTKIDISKVDSRNNDFSVTELYKKLATEERNNLVVNICKNDFNDRKTLVFCINIKHSLEITALLNQSGISAAHIDGTFSPAERARILASFREGEVSVLCNCQLLTEGFDEPAIDGILLARPTRSRSLFNQMIGRGLRIFPGKETCKIIDIVDIHKNLSGFIGLIDDYKFDDIESFQSIRDIDKYAKEQDIKIAKYKLERANLIKYQVGSDFEPTDSMMMYLKDNHIDYFEPITFDEASFLIWYDKLTKEFHGLDKNFRR